MLFCPACRMIWSVTTPSFARKRADSKVFNALRRSQFPSLLMRRICSSVREIFTLFLIVLRCFFIKILCFLINSNISSSDNFSKTKTLHLLRSALLTVKLGFSVVAQIRMTVPFSTYGSKVSCWALFRRWISSRKMIVVFPYWKLSFACSTSLSRSSFLLVTHER